jgi:NADH-quinone oxidoreductase subunit J
MQDFLFFLLSGLALGCGFLVVANPFSRSPVTSAMFLVLSIVALAGLFVLLHAFFLAAVQILVYAGAVMVLFLFVIMLLDLSVEERRAWNRRFGWITGVVAVGAFALILLGAVVKPGSEAAGDTHARGKRGIAGAEFVPGVFVAVRDAVGAAAGGDGRGDPC